MFRIQINTGGWISVVIITAITVLVCINLWRVGVNAQESMDVFTFEQDSLTNLQSENSQLLAELEYYQSYEYKKLYARDNLRLAEANERLFKVADPIDYFEVKESAPDFLTPENYSSWWFAIL
jgi:hypothetical protein